MADCNLWSIFNYLLDFFIDEQSPDEDERQARSLLAQPVAKTQNIRTGTNPMATDLEGHDVLMGHRNRNKAVKPPTLGRLRNSRLQQPAQSDECNCQPSSESGEGIQVAVLQHTVAPSEARSDSSPPANLNPAQFAFYYQFTGWVSVLEEAKAKFRLYLVTSGTPFPSTEHHGSVASTCITEAMTDFHRDNVAKVVLDKCMRFTL